MPSDISATPDSSPWSDTEEMALPGEPAKASKGPASGRNKGSDQLPTIGHIGRYALKYQIGEGGLGRVYAAHDPLLSRLIAIKTLNIEISADERESFNALFLNEARAAGGLSHPHIVTVFDAGVSDQGAYIAMELLKGRDLRQLRLEGWKPTPTQAALIVRRVSDALAYAHSKGVVHRDIKPANIFMVGRTQPRVLDFGIARIAHQHEQAENDIAGGSPYYMSPEQVRQHPIDRRCDVFSLGVVLYELLTGARPFRGTSFNEITDAVLSFDPPKAHDVDASVPAALSDIAARAMEKNPEHRYRSARALSRELRHWLEEHAQDAPDPAEDAAPAPQRKAPWAMAAAAALVLGVAALWWLPQAQNNDAAPDPVSTLAPAVPSPETPQPVATAITDTGPEPAPAAEPPPDPPAEPTGSAQASAEPETAANAATAGLPIVAPPSPAPPAATPAPAPAPATAAKPKVAPRETPRERRAREARERDARLATTAPAAAPATGTLRLAISPWGQVEVNGRAAGTTPPLNELTLPEGRHTVTVRNGDFPPFVSTIQIAPGQPASIKHRFGS